MSDVITTATVPQAQSPVAGAAQALSVHLTAEQVAAYTALLAPTPLYANAAPAVRALLVRDAHWALSEGLEQAEYVEGLREWGGTAEEYLAESGLDAEPAAEPTVAEPAAAAPVAGQATAEQVAEQEQAVREDAEKVAKAAIRAYAVGQKAAFHGELECARLGDAYLHQRMAIGGPRNAKAEREAAVDRLERDLAIYTTGKPDFNRMLAVYHAYRLLAEETGLAGTPKKPGIAAGVPYTHYRDHWMRLVERQAKGTAEEHWTLTPGFEDRCRALFAKAAKDGLSAASVGNEVRTLLADYADAQATAAAEAKARADAELAAAQVERAKGRAELERLEREQQEAAAAAQREQDEAAKARMTANAAEAAEKLRREQAEHNLRIAREEEAKREAARKAEQEAEARAAKEKADRKAQAAQDKADGKKGKPAAGKAAEAEQPARERATSAENLLKSRADAAVEATPQQWAELTVEFLCEHPEPEDVLEYVLAQLVAGGDLSRKGKTACETALHILRRPEKATGKAETNGHGNGHANGTVQPAAAVA